MLDVGESCSGGGSKTGLSFRLAENFFLLRLSAAKPKFKCRWWWCDLLLLLLLDLLLEDDLSLLELFRWWSLFVFDWWWWWWWLLWWWLSTLSGLSRLGLESVGLSVTASEFGLLLWLADSLRLWFGELHTESSDCERPMKRDTLPDFAASIKVPSRDKEWDLRFYNIKI